MLTFYYFSNRPPLIRLRPALTLGLVLVLTSLALGCASASNLTGRDAAAGPTTLPSGGFGAPNVGTTSPPPQVDEQAPDLPPKPAACPKLESVLHQLSVASDPASFAQQHGVNYEAGLVRVVIDLHTPTAALPAGYQLKEERRLGRQVRVLAPLSSLCPLSEQAAVDFIHVPLTPGVFGPG